MTNRTWIRRPFARAPRTIRKAPASRRPAFESLEDRNLLTVMFHPNPEFVADYVAGFKPDSMVVSDFNGDGKPDLAAGSSNFSEYEVNVLLNNGDGTFASPVPYFTGNGPHLLAVGDFNGDNKPDLAVGNVIDGTVSVLLNNGNGTFAGAVVYDAGGNPSSIAVGDFNGDGKQDLAVSNEIFGFGGNLRILLGNGDGAFASAGDFAVAAASMAVGDFNGDGKQDLAMASGSLNVLLGNGNGAFASPVNYGAAGGSVAVGDFNGDGKQDLAVGYGNVLLNNGDGTFGSPVSYLSGFGPRSVAMGDFNGDGKQDLAVVGSDSSNVRLVLGKGDGTFASPVEYVYKFVGGEYSVGGHSVAVGDFNGDGKLDLATANFNTSASGSVSVFLNNGERIFASPPIDFDWNSTPMGLVGDFNGDGKLDLARMVDIDPRPFNENVSVFLGNGDGTFASPVLSEAGLGHVAAVGDFNGDGKQDLVVGDYVNKVSISVHLGNGDGTFASPVIYADAGGRSVAVGDFNGDGKPDLVSGTGSNNMPRIWVFLNNGDGTFASPVNYLTNDFTGHDFTVAVGDFNGDGTLDLAWGKSFLTVLLGNGDGTFASPVMYELEMGGTMAVGDFNGDGKLDLAGSSSFYGGVKVLLGNGDGTFANPFYINGFETPGNLVVGDFNGDGRQDLAAATSIITSVYLGNGDGTFASPQFYEGDAWRVAVGDFNGDGRQDLVTTSGVLINDIPSIARDQAAVIVSAGSPASNTGTFDDAQGRGAMMLTASLGTVIKNDAAGTWSWSYTPPGGPSGPTTVTITAIDSSVLTVTTTFTIAVASPGDYNSNGVVDSADYVVWRKTLGAGPLAAFSGADGDGDGMIGQGDYDVWRAHFGQTLPAAAAGASDVASQELTAATNEETATSVTNEVAMPVLTTAKEGSDTAPNPAKPGVDAPLVGFADAAGSPRVRTRQDATTTSGSADAMLNDYALLAWFSLPRFNDLPLAEEISSNRHSNEDVKQVDDSELNSGDEIFAGLANARLIDL